MLNPKDKQVLADLKMIADALAVSLLVIGAGSRWLIFDQQMGVEGRTTTDWDVAIRVQSWAEYQMLSDRMTQAPAPRFRQKQIPHKFIHRLTGPEVDLVPFGAIGKPDQRLEWPDGNQMNLPGLQELLFRILQNQDRLIPQLISRNIHGSAWDELFLAVVRRLEVLHHGIYDRLRPPHE